MSGMPIRTATLHDLDAILRIQQEALASGAGSLYSFDELEKWAEDLSSETYESAIRGEQVFVSADGAARVTGFSQFDPNTGVIGITCVSGQRQGEGVGRELVKDCLLRARKASLESVRVSAPLDTVEFYERLEFESGEPAAKILKDGTAVALRSMSRPVMLPRIREYIAGLSESVEFFAPGRNKNYEKELIVVGAFLRGLKIEFKEEELTQGSDPPDVCFRDARFEVKALYDNSRLMHKEYKDQLRAAKEVFFSSDLLEDVTPKAVPLAELVQKAAGVAIDRAPKYPLEKRKTLDLVVYANLQHIWQITPSSWPDLSLLEEQQWRSVSFTRGTSTSCVLVVSDDAPEFLRLARGRLMHGSSDAAAV